MLRHCTLTELLGVRDGEGSGFARSHLVECADCGAALELLHQRRAALRALPTLTAPRDRWTVVRQVFVKSRRRVQWQRVEGVLAAVAGLVLLVGVGTVLRGGASDRAEALELQALVQQSEALDQALRQVASERRVLNGLTALVIADFEDQVAVVDSEIAATRFANIGRGEMADLWRLRVALVDALVTTHTRRAAYVAF